MSLKRIAIALPLSLALVGLACTPAWADDDEPAPTRVRVKLKAKPAKPVPAAQSPKSPMQVVQQWLMGKAAQSMAGGSAVNGGALDAWFEGGSDVPLADLRDALKAEGWTGASMKVWLMGEVARQAPQMMHMFRRHGSSQGAAPRTFPWFGQQADPRRQQGGFAPQRHGQGMRRGPHFHGRRFGPRGRRGRGFRGPGPHGQGFRGQGFRGQGFRGPGFRGPGQHGEGAQGHGMGGRGLGGPGRPWQGQGQPRVQTQQRAFILWHDGAGWQQRELPGGRGPGAGGIPSMIGIPGLGPTPGPGAPTHGGWVPGRAGQPGKAGMPGAPGRSGHFAPRPGATPAAPPSINRHRINIEGLEKIREMLRSLQSKKGTTLDAATLQKLREALKPHGAAVGGAGPAPAPGRKVHVGLVPSGEVEVVEETEIKDVGPGR